MKLRDKLRALALMLAALLILLAGCATPPAPLPPAVVKAPAIPPLSPLARQAPIQDLCSPTCSENWRNAVDGWRLRLMSPASPGGSVQVPTTH